MNGYYTTLVVITSISTILAMIALIVKLHYKLTIRMDNSPTCLVGKTAMVTGANTGIGFYAAQDFAKRGARVLLACRDAKKAEIARDKIVEATGNSNVTVKIVDFASLESVRQLAKIINQTEERLDILVNNAGVLGSEDIKTKDGLNYLMQINHFGPFLLTILLIDLIKRSAPSRIVNVSSIGAHVFSKLNPSDLNNYPKGRLRRITNYGNSKMCNILFTKELARRLRGSGVDTNVLHPGVVDTQIINGLTTTTGNMSVKILSAFSKTPEEGAQTTIFLAVSKEIEGISGEYFENCKFAWVPPVAEDPNLAKLVWEKSEDSVELAPEERRI